MDLFSDFASTQCVAHVLRHTVLSDAIGFESDQNRLTDSRCHGAEDEEGEREKGKELLPLGKLLGMKNRRTDNFLLETEAEIEMCQTNDLRVCVCVCVCVSFYLAFSEKRCFVFEIKSVHSRKKKKVRYQI